MNASSIFRLISDGITARLKLERIGDPFHPLDPPHGLLRTVTLVVPLDLSLEGYPATMDKDLDGLPAIRELRLQRSNRIAGNIGIGPLVD